MTRGIRNDNPLNIRHGKSQWVGMREKQTDKAFVQFKSRVYGYWKISRIWSAGNCKKLTPTLAQSHAPFIITYN